MYRVLIVDDEYLVRKGILDKLSNLNFDFSSIKEAASAEEALEMINKEELPHIILLDISMSGMNGLQLIREVKKRNSGIHFGILSGHAEFCYAKDALELGVDGYLLKPVSIGALTELMEKIISNMNNEKEVDLIKEKQETLIKSNSFFEIERALNQLFHANKPESEGEFSRIFCHSFISTSNSFAVILVHLDNPDGYTMGEKVKSEVICDNKTKIKSIIKHIVTKENAIVIDDYRFNTNLIILLGGNDTEALNKACDAIAARVLSETCELNTTGITIGISGVLNRVTNTLYKQARKAVDMKLINGNGYIYRYEGIKNSEKISFPHDKLKLFQNYITIFDLKSIEKTLFELFIPQNGSSVSTTYVRMLFNEVVSILLKYCDQKGINLEEIIDNDIISGDILNDVNEPKDVAKLLNDIIVNTLKMKSDSVTSCRELVNKIKSYIDKNYSSDISVKVLARSYAVNPNYLSSIFKKETGFNISSYITLIRVEKACQLLKSTDLSVWDIANQVGYTDSLYFYKVFKKIKGMTALDYRKLN